MKRSIMLLVLAAIVTIGTVAVSGQAPDKPRSGFLSILREGQLVTLKEVGGRYEIGTFDNMPGPLGHKIIEIGPDWLTVEDIAGITETRISLYSITAVVRLKVPRK